MASYLTCFLSDQHDHKLVHSRCDYHHNEPTKTQASCLRNTSVNASLSTMELDRHSQLRRWDGLDADGRRACPPLVFSSAGLAKRCQVSFPCSTGPPRTLRSIYGIDCVTDLLPYAVQHDTFFPPRCQRQTISFNQVQPPSCFPEMIPSHLYPSRIDITLQSID